jgi:hypothetical protein
VRSRWVVTTLLVVATLVAFLAVFALWVNRQAMNTDNWTDTSTELLESEPVREQLAFFLVDQLYSNVDVAGELRGLLPPQAQGLASPAAGGLRELMQRGAERALEGPRFQALWEEANRRAHRRFIQVLEGKSTDTVSTEEGEVTLDLRTILERTTQQVGVGGRLVDKLPPDAAQLTVLKSDQLKTAQDIADLIRGLAIVLVVLTLALFALAVYLARDRRRETLRAVGFGFIAAGALAIIVRALVGDVVVNALTGTAAVKPAVEDVWRIGTSILYDSAVSVIVNGLLIVIVAWVAGPTRLAVELRQAAAPHMRDRPALAYAVLAAILLLFIAWGPTPAFRRPLSLLLIAGLLVLGMEVLRRQTAREFPDAQSGDAMARIRAWVDRRRPATG